MSHTAIPEDELKVFASIEDIKIVFDVGARDDVDYLILKPDIELHAFEPNPEFFKELSGNVGSHPNVYLNNFALTEDVNDEAGYDPASEKLIQSGGMRVKTRTLDEYVSSKGIEQIDFLKLDVEGSEYRVLQGGTKTIPKCRYIQYEGYDGRVNEFLNGFTPYYIGYSNTICVRDGEKMPWIPVPTQEGGLVEKTEKNYL